MRSKIIQALSLIELSLGFWFFSDNSLAPAERYLWCDLPDIIN